MRCKAGVLGANREIPWDITTAAYRHDINVNDRERVPEAMSFSSDGTRMFVVGSVSKTVVAYLLSAAWDLSTASYEASKAINNPTQNATWAVDAMAFKPDGAKLFVSGSGFLQEYSLSTAWDISTATHSQTTAVGVRGLAFKPDGTALLTASRSLTDTVTKRDLSVAWDISSASVSQQFSASVFAEDLFLSSDGSLLFLVAGGPDIYKYVLSTPWDIATATLAQTRLIRNSITYTANGIAFRDDGSSMFICGNQSGNPPTISPVVHYSIG